MIDWKKKFLRFIDGEDLFHRKEPVLLAVSGGVDSIVIAHLFSECKFSFGIAHINFQLRGKDSDDDEKFVRELSEKFKVKFFSKRFNTEEYASENRLSIQMAARELRYSWLEETRKQNCFHRIATGHHADDSVETALMNMLRGTGIHGLHGILPKHEKIIRPMLCFSKKEIEEYALSHKISFRQDPSNFGTDYDRNKIRLEIIPAVEKHFPSFKKTFAGNILKWKDAAALYDDNIERIKKKVGTQKGEELIISAGKLKSFPFYKTVLFELLKEFGFNTDQSEQIADALNAEPGKMFFSPTHRLLKDRKNLVVSELTTSSATSVQIHEIDEKVIIGNTHLKISQHQAKDFVISREPRYSYLDMKELGFPLILRKWKPGDYFYPFGMKKKKKKISDYLVDKKISLTEKEKICVIESGKRIACIVGERIDERFKITHSTQRVLRIELLKE